ncbi:MAG: biopolymer transporter ExbD [Planctomycetota bacterium]|nr:biopolymer transporter ExbD [Planctomycetota bacterium]
MQIPTLINRGRIGFNMTPMIDVVFLLIIFFLVASHLSDQETQVEIDLPDATSGLPQEDLANRVTVNLPEEGEILVSGRVLSVDELLEQIVRIRSSVGEDLEIRIRGNRKVTYETVGAVLKACADAGVWNVTFAVYGKS